MIEFADKMLKDILVCLLFDVNILFSTYCATWGEWIALSLSKLEDFCESVAVALFLNKMRRYYIAGYFQVIMWLKSWQEILTSLQKSSHDLCHSFVLTFDPLFFLYLLRFAVENRLGWTDEERWTSFFFPQNAGGVWICLQWM